LSQKLSKNSYFSSKVIGPITNFMMRYWNWKCTLTCVWHRFGVITQFWNSIWRRFGLDCKVLCKTTCGRL